MQTREEETLEDTPLQVVFILGDAVLEVLFTYTMLSSTNFHA